MIPRLVSASFRRCVSSSSAGETRGHNQGEDVAVTTATRPARSTAKRRLLPTSGHESNLQGDLGSRRAVAGDLTRMTVLHYSWSDGLLEEVGVAVSSLFEMFDSWSAPGLLCPEDDEVELETFDRPSSRSLTPANISTKRRTVVSFF